MKLKILGHEFKVIYDPEWNNHRGHQATVFFNNHTIRIDNSFPKSAQKVSLLHEIIEILNDSFQMKLEHEKISILAEGLNQVLTDNKILLREYLGEVK